MWAPEGLLSWGLGFGFREKHNVSAREGKSVSHFLFFFLKLSRCNNCELGISVCFSRLRVGIWSQRRAAQDCSVFIRKWGDTFGGVHGEAEPRCEHFGSCVSCVRGDLVGCVPRLLRVPSTVE